MTKTKAELKRLAERQPLVVMWAAGFKQNLIDRCKFEEAANIRDLILLANRPINKVSRKSQEGRKL